MKKEGDRWRLRNKIVWGKQILLKKENRTVGSVMPTSVKDRFNESYEFLYFFVKNKKYYSDLDAVRMPTRVLGVTDMRASGFVRSRELRYDSKYLNDFSPQSKQSGQRFNYRVRDAKRKKGQPQFKASEEEINRYGKGSEYEQRYGEPWDRFGKNTKKAKGVKFNISNRQAELKKGDLLPASQRVRGFFDEFGGKINPAGKNLPTIWQIQSEPHNFQHELDIDIDHFAIFPQALCEIPIKFGCPKNGIVLDPFCGSATALIVAKKLGRNYLGIELSPKYVALAEERILRECPPTLFQ